jgi:hypothetical protein
LNPAWDADKIYLEARRIVGAQIQHITYNEFLPGIVGMGAMTKYGLELRTAGYFSDYDMQLDASTFNSFAVAAGQFFWSMFPDYLGKTKSQQALSELFYNPSYLAAADGFDGLIR